MKAENSVFWTAIRRARDKLVDQYLDHPLVSLIDIGYVPQSKGDREIALRIHIRKHNQLLKTEVEKEIAFPEEIDGIPVIVIAGNYRLENKESNLDNG